MYHLGLDIGTSSTKAVAFDQSGRALGEVARPYPTLTPSPAGKSKTRNR